MSADIIFLIKRWNVLSCLFYPEGSILPVLSRDSMRPQELSTATFMDIFVSIQQIGMKQSIKTLKELYKNKRMYHDKEKTERSMLCLAL